MRGPPTFELNTLGQQGVVDRERVENQRKLIQRIMSLTIVDSDVGSDELVVKIDNHDGKALENTEIVHGRVWGVSIGYENEMSAWRSFVVSKIQGFFTITITAYDEDSNVFHDKEKSKEWTVQAVLDAVGRGRLLPNTLRRGIAGVVTDPGGVLRSEVAAGVIAARKLHLPGFRNPIRDTRYSTSPVPPPSDIRFELPIAIPVPGEVAVPRFTGPKLRRAVGFNGISVIQRTPPPTGGDAIEAAEVITKDANDSLGGTGTPDLITSVNAGFTGSNLFTRVRITESTKGNNDTYDINRVIGPTLARVTAQFLEEGSGWQLTLPATVTVPTAKFTAFDLGRRLRIFGASNPVNNRTVLITKIISPDRVQVSALSGISQDPPLVDEGAGFKTEIIYPRNDPEVPDREAIIAEQRKPKKQIVEVNYWYRVQDSAGRFDKIMQTNQTDAQFLSKLAKALGYVWYIDAYRKKWAGHTIPIVHFKERDFGQPVSYEFDIRDEILVAEPRIDFDIFDIPDRSFSRNLDPAQQAIAAAEQRLDITRRVLNSSATPYRDLEREFPTTGLDQNKVAEEADGIYKRLEEHLLKMSIRFVGDPRVYPKRMCILRNFIYPFTDMPCYIQSIKYTLVPGEAFTMELKLMSKAVNFNTSTDVARELRRLERVRRDLISNNQKAQKDRSKAFYEEAFRGLATSTPTRFINAPITGQYTKGEPSGTDFIDPKVIKDRK